MSVYSLMIYGSCARGDNKPDSDVDMLAVHSEQYYKMNSHNKLNIAFYNKELLEHRMKTGNLFCLHLVKEGKIIYDNENLLQNILTSFTYKSNYSSEIKEASDLAWTLIRFSSEFDNYFSVNKKIAWCYRTIIIAKSAENRNPVFAKNELIKFTNDESFAEIIDAKDNMKFSARIFKLMEVFLARWGTQAPNWLNKINSFNDAHEYFEDGSYAKYITRTFKDPGY